MRKTQLKNTEKKIRPRNMKKAEAFLLLTALNVICVSQAAFAASGSSIITNGFQNLTDLVKAFVSSIGTIVVLWGLFEWGNSMQSNDGMMQSAAFKRIGGGLVMMLGGELLNLFI